MPAYLLLLFLQLFVGNVFLPTTILLASTDTEKPKLHLEFVNEKAPNDKTLSAILKRLRHKSKKQRDVAAEDLKNLGPGLLKSEYFKREGLKSSHKQVRAESKIVFEYYEQLFTPYSAKELKKQIVFAGQQSISRAPKFDISLESISALLVLFIQTHESKLKEFQGLSKEHEKIVALQEEETNDSLDKQSQSLKEKMFKMGDEIRDAFLKTLQKNFSYQLVEGRVQVKIGSHLFSYERPDPEVPWEYLLVYLKPLDKAYEWEFTEEDLFKRTEKRLPIALQKQLFPLKLKDFKAGYNLYLNVTLDQYSSTKYGCRPFFKVGSSESLGKFQSTDWIQLSSRCMNFIESQLASY